MNSIIDLTISQSISTYIGSLEHYLLIVMGIVGIVVMMLIFVNRSKRIRQVALLSSVLAIVALEVIKYVLKYKYLQVNNIVMSAWEFADINLCNIIAIISVPLILTSMRLDNHHPWSRFANSFIFSMGIIAGATLFAYPVALIPGLPMYNVLNLCYILIAFTLLSVSIHIGFTDFLEVNMHDVWMAVISLGITLIVSYILYFSSNRTVNPLFVDSCPILEKLNLHIPFPWQVLPVLAALFLIQVVLYIPFQWHDKRRNKIEE